jgi:hypothetical protein
VVPNGVEIDMLLKRFCAYYDEPGVVGTISGILFLCNGFNFKKICNIPIFIGGILSFSLAFYLVLIIYGIFFLPLKYKLFFTSVFIILLFVFNQNQVVQLVNNYIFSRMQIKNGEWVGDNRTISSFDNWYNNFKKTDDFYWGIGREKSLIVNLGGASYKDLIVSYGVVFFIIYCLAFFFMAYGRFGLRKELYIFLFLFLAIIYQRPFITNYFYVFLLYIPIISLPEKRVVNSTIKRYIDVQYSANPSKIIQQHERV